MSALDPVILNEIKKIQKTQEASSPVEIGDLIPIHSSSRLVERGREAYLQSGYVETDKTKYPDVEFKDVVSSKFLVQTSFTPSSASFVGWSEGAGGHSYAVFGSDGNIYRAVNFTGTMNLWAQTGLGSAGTRGWQTCVHDGKVYAAANNKTIVYKFDEITAVKTNINFASFYGYGLATDGTNFYRIGYNKLMVAPIGGGVVKTFTIDFPQYSSSQQLYIVYMASRNSLLITVGTTLAKELPLDTKVIKDFWVDSSFLSSYYPYQGLSILGENITTYREAGTTKYRAIFSPIKQGSGAPGAARDYKSGLPLYMRVK